jgi:hypothetical protein
LSRRITDAGYACNEDYCCDACKPHDGIERPIIATLAGGNAKECDGDAAFYCCCTDGVKVLCNVEGLYGSAFCWSKRATNGVP